MSDELPVNTPPAEKAALPDIEIRDPAIGGADPLAEVDIAAIMQRIRERIRERSEAAQANGQPYDLPEAAAEFDRLSPRHAVGPASGPAAGPASGTRLTLERLRSAANGVFVQLAVVEKRPLPIVGPLLTRLRSGVHQLVLYYVQTLATRQSAFNRASLETFQQMAYELEQAKARVAQLEQEHKTPPKP